MAVGEMRWLFYLFIITFFIIISYTFLIGRSQYSQGFIPQKEVVVYKENDVIKLLESLNLQNRVQKDEAKKIDNSSSIINKYQSLKKIEENENLRHDYLNRYPTFMNCRNENLKKWTADISQTNVDYKAPAPRVTHDAMINRAVLLYYPIELSDNFKLEFKWLYRSWIEMQKSEPKKWRTDFIVFIENDPKFFKDNKSFLNELNCSFDNKRTSKADKPMCTLINYVALKKRQTTGPVVKYDDLLSNVDIFGDNKENLAPFYNIAKENLLNYGYVDSILMAFDGYEYFKTAGYDFLIRSDMDVFLTPLFGKWLPNNCNDFYVGRGGYSDDFNRKRLARIAKDLGLKHAGISNLGSTWYSTPEQFRLVSYLTIFSMAYLSKEEFSQPEREGKLGTLLWPQWHYGVLLLYGQNIGINHLIGSKQLNVVKLEDLIDYPSANQEAVDQKLHIHVFHGDDLFSKFSYKVGKYDDMIVNDNDLGKVKFYCLKMALDAKKKSNEELKKMFDEQIATKI